MKIRLFEFYPESGSLLYRLPTVFIALPPTGHTDLTAGKSCRHGDWDGQSITDHAARPQYLSCISYYTNTHRHTPTPSAQHTPCGEPGHTPLPHTAQSLPLADRGSSSPTGGFYLWCQTTRGRSSAAGTPRPRSRPPCRSPWWWSCRPARRRAAGGSRGEVGGSTRCAGEPWRTSEGGHCPSLWSEERRMLDYKVGKRLRKESVAQRFHLNNQRTKMCEYFWVLECNVKWNLAIPTSN